MDIETLSQPIAVTVEAGDVFDGTPEVVDLHYDLWTLRVALRFEALDHPVYVSFEQVRGFRVLDEGDLLEFWDDDTRVDGWLWEIEQGGWLDLERLRDGFVTAAVDGCREFLILGVSECVSVIARDEPTIYAPGI